MITGMTNIGTISGGKFKLVNDIEKVDEQMKFVLSMSDFSRTYKQKTIPQLSRMIQRTNTEELAELYLFDLARIINDTTKASLLNVTSVIDARNGNTTVFTYGYRYDNTIINATNAVAYI